MKLVIAVSFLLFLPMFSSGLVENSHLENAHYEVEEVVKNGGRIDLEMDYAMPHPRRPTPSDQRPPPPPRTFEEVVTNGERIDLEIDYAMPHPRRPTPSDQRPPPPRAFEKVMTNGGRIDLEMDYAMPHPRPSTPSDQRPPPPSRAHHAYGKKIYKT